MSHYRAWLDTFPRPAARSLIDAIEQTAAQLKTASHIDELRGLEGYVARQIYPFMNRTIKIAGFESQLREPRGKREVKHRTLANLTDWPKHILAGLRLLLRGHQPSLALSSESFRITRSLPHGHVEAVFRVVGTLGLDRLLGSKLSPERNLALAMIVARILDPGSKLATARSLDCQTLSSTLAEQCHLEGAIHENELYARTGLARESSVSN